MNNADDRYFNFPVTLLSGFLTDSRRVLDNMFDYSFYTQTLKYEFGNYQQKMSDAETYFGVTCGNKNRVYNNGKELFNSIPKKTPKVGINKDIWFDYYKNEKTEFQKVCLLGFLAIKSILGTKSYCKIDNKYWLSRMNGQSKTVEKELLSPEIRFYFNEYQTKKIKTELILNWGLVHYSRFTRGFYVSFNMTLEQLVFEAEKKRKSTREKQLKQQTDEAVKKALQQLY